MSSVCTAWVSLCAHVHLCLRDELGDLLAGVERCHLHVSHTPVGPTSSVQDLVMFLQDFTETSEVQVLWTDTRKQLLHTKQTDGKVYLLQTNRKPKHIYLYEEMKSVSVCVMIPGSSGAGWGWGRTRWRLASGPWCCGVCSAPPATGGTSSCVSAGRAERCSRAERPVKTAAHSAAWQSVSGLLQAFLQDRRQDRNIIKIVFSYGLVLLIIVVLILHHIQMFFYSTLDGLSGYGTLVPLNLAILFYKTSRL